MAKIHKNQSGFGAIEVLLLLIFLALLALVGLYVANNHASTKNAAKISQPTSVAPSAKTVTTAESAPTHTAQDAKTFVQNTYTTYLNAVNTANSSGNNNQPLGLVGLAAVKANLTTDFYNQAVASHNGSDFSCAAQFVPSAYTAGSATASGTKAEVPLTIANSSDGSSTTTGMTVTVDLLYLKISSVSCPS